MPYHRWEPIYIGSKEEPFYNEKLSWEGLQDKMLQVRNFPFKNYVFITSIQIIIIKINAGLHGMEENNIDDIFTKKRKND